MLCEARVAPFLSGVFVCRFPRLGLVLIIKRAQESKKTRMADSSPWQIARNDLSPFEEAASSWSCRGLSNFYYQKISVSNLKGLGHFFMVVAAMLRSANGVAFV